MKALVTGASGFVGSTLIEELNTLGFDVAALMRRTSSPTNLDGLHYRRVEGDLADGDALRRAVKDVDYVFHLAGTVAARDRSTYFEHNAEGTRRLAEAVAETRPGLTRFVFVSSLAAAGPATSLQPRIESETEAPVSAYGQSKLKAEHDLLKFKDVFPISIIRPPMVYGPKDKATFLFVQTVARNLVPIFRGASETGHKYYSAVHVRDVCRGLVQAALAPLSQVPSGEKFYLADDTVFTYEEMMSTIAEKLNRDPLKIRLPMSVLKIAAVGLTALGKVTRRSFPLNLDKLNELTPDYWICSNEKAKRMLGFVPEFDLSKGMGDAIAWYKKQKWI